MACSFLVLVAGAEAMVSQLGIAVASGLLTLAMFVGLAGYAYARDRRLGMGLLVLLAAALPLFGALYAAGLAVLHLLGQTMAGVLLVLLAVALAIATSVMSLRWSRHAPR